MTRPPQGGAPVAEVLEPLEPDAALAPGPGVLAVILAAAPGLFAEGAAPGSRAGAGSGWHDVPADSWRFSGRSWARPATLRRERPT